MLNQLFIFSVFLDASILDGAKNVLLDFLLLIQSTGMRAAVIDDY